MNDLETGRTGPRAGIPAELRAVWIWMVALTLASVVFAWVSYGMGKDPIYYQAFSPPTMHFGDFTIYEQKFALFHTTAFFHTFFPFTYPAPVALVYESFFKLFGVYATPCFVAFSVVSVLIPAILFARALERRGLSRPIAWGFTATAVVCSWPALLVIDRGNLEIVVWISLVTAMWAFCTGRMRTAAVFFGVAAAFKLFPFLFFALFLSTRRYKEFAIAVAVFVGLTLAGLAILGPTIPIAAAGISTGIQYFARSYMAEWHSWENGVDHSIFAALKMAMITVLHYPKHYVFTRELSVYNTCAALAGIVLYFARIRLLPLLNQILILSIISIYFTAFSGDGTLLHLYYAFGLLLFVALDAWERGIVVPKLMTAMCLLAFLVSYEGFCVVGNHRFEGEVKCVAMGWLLLTAFRHPFGAALHSRPDKADALAYPNASLVVAEAA